MTRRQAIKTTTLVTVAAAAAPGVIAQTPSAATAPGPFKLPALPYALVALEPHIDARTMEIHHGKHHKAYVDNLNKALADSPDLQEKPIEDLLKGLDSTPEKIRTALRNNGGGHYNHSLFWQMMKPNGGEAPAGEIAKVIEKSFGSFTNFKTKFTEAALKVFGSGWVWLVAAGPGGAWIETWPNQDSPIIPAPLSPEAQAFIKDLNLAGSGISTKLPLLGLDVWEHAYYLKYQNKRADYITAWWNVVNWDFVAERYAKLKG